ncbi:MmcQ/YjbR family DNA-binding protein [Oscillospiraceae bacterium HV4-5-C5C]|nr:MmcQ/YjbR family DNA-binding protein [Oscillospiraceae bacterium HV4-5-C5C]
MNRPELIRCCLSYPQVYEDYPFDEDRHSAAAWTVMRHKNNQKSFAFIFERQGSLLVNLKCDPLDADLLRQAFSAITPAYHMNKRHWNTVAVNGDVPADLLRQLISSSYALTDPPGKPLRRGRRKGRAQG